MNGVSKGRPLLSIFSKIVEAKRRPPYTAPSLAHSMSELPFIENSMKGDPPPFEGASIGLVAKVIDDIPSIHNEYQAGKGVKFRL